MVPEPHGNQELDLEQDLTKRTLNVEESVDLAVNNINPRLLLLFIFAGSCMWGSAMAILTTVFTGEIPYTQWKCLEKSEKCASAIFQATLAGGNATSGTNTTSQDVINRNTMCSNHLQPGEDFVWTSPHTTFSQEWGLHCEGEAKLGLISSIFFIGSFIGLVASTAIFDRFGRRKGALIAAAVTFISVVLSAVAPNYEVLFVMRLVMGYGQIVSYTGGYCWILELTPKSRRNFVSGFVRLNFVFSYFSLIAIAYFINSWRFVYAACAVVNGICIIPLVFLPDSPRFNLIRGMEKEAKSTLNSISSIAQTNVDFNNVNLVFEVRKQSFLQQVKDFKKFPIMFKELALVMMSWLLLACVAYGYSFGWSNMGHDLYTSCTLEAVGQAIIFTSAVPICSLLGRKNTIIFFLMGCMTSNFVGMIEYPISRTWTIRHLAGMAGSMFANGAFLMMYLFVIERAPTTHSGMMLSLGSGSARVGSFFSPQVNLLYGITDSRVPLGVFAGMALLSLCAISALSDTTGKSIPQTPEDMERQRKAKRDGVRGGVLTGGVTMVTGDAGSKGAENAEDVSERHVIANPMNTFGEKDLGLTGSV